MKKLITATKPLLISFKERLGASNDDYIEACDFVVNIALGIIIKEANSAQEGHSYLHQARLLDVISSVREILTTLSSMDMSYEIKTEITRK
ncbi:MAG: hypothetical protein Q9M91_06810 [Candidatus Dojkabacteria bacterium]|nr:hypothetical protein [Candidatus Dojkabacteria bacterium]